MILIGMFDSPFVRRVAVSMALLDLPFEHYDWSVGKDFERIRQYNPLGRVPTLVLDDSEVLIESAAILDYLDQQAGPERALLPPHGEPRRAALSLMALASGAAEKAVAQIYERAFRPEEKRHQPWLDRCAGQMHGALAELERRCAARPSSAWLVGARLSQADITAACVYSLIADAVGFGTAAYPALRRLVERCESMAQFKAFRAPFFTPGAGAAAPENT